MHIEGKDVYRYAKAKLETPARLEEAGGPGEVGARSHSVIDVLDRRRLRRPHMLLPAEAWASQGSILRPPSISDFI